MLSADLTWTCCYALEKSIASPCLSFPTGCMAVIAQHHLWTPVCISLTYICLTYSVKTSRSPDILKGHEVLLKKHNWLPDL